MKNKHGQSQDMLTLNLQVKQNSANCCKAESNRPNSELLIDGEPSLARGTNKE